MERRSADDVKAKRGNLVLCAVGDYFSAPPRYEFGTVASIFSDGAVKAVNIFRTTDFSTRRELRDLKNYWVIADGELRDREEFIKAVLDRYNEFLSLAEARDFAKGFKSE